MKYIFTLLFLFLFFSAHSQSIVYVTLGGQGNQSGSSWANAISGFSEFQRRLAMAPPGTQFWLQSGNYRPTTGTDRNATFFIPSSVQVYGGFFGDETSLAQRNPTRPFSTTLSGNIGQIDNADDNSFHVVTFRNASTATRIDGFVIRGGYGGAGGGVYNDGSGAGGRSEPTITNCLITENTASDGAGMHNNGYLGNASPTIINCIFSANRAFNNGGGMYNNGYQGVCNPIITNCLSYSNTARDGGAYYNEAYQGTCRPVLQNCTIANNRSTAPNTNYGSGALYNDAPQQGNCSPTVRNCVIWGNTAEFAPTTITSIYNNGLVNLSITYSDIQEGYDGAGNISQNPNFVSTSINDYRLSGSSSLINAGDPNSTPVTVSSTDLFNRSRVQQGRIDMGAYEYQENPDKYFVTFNGAGDRSGSSWSNALRAGQLKSFLVNASERSIFWIAGGKYIPGLIVTETFQIATGVQVYGGFAGTEINLSDRMLTSPSSTTLSGEEGDPNSIIDNNRHVVTFKNVSSSTRLDGVVITAGYANSTPSPNNAGGGIFNSSNGANNRSDPLIVNCLIIKNTAGSGGGLYNNPQDKATCAPIIQNCVFEENVAYNNGGGSYNDNSGSVNSPTFINCTFRKNTAQFGGGISQGCSYNGVLGGDNPRFLNCVFSQNIATQRGGAVNISAFSGLIRPTFTNCLFTDNNTQETGGAVYFIGFYYSTIESTITNCSLINNTAPTGSGLFTSRYDDSNVSIRMNNSLVRNNTIAHEASSSRIAPTYNITYSNIQGGFAGTGNIDQDPQFVDAGNGNYRLRAGSPSINTGDPNSTAATVSDKDLDGNTRVAENRIDMGAYEFQVASQTGADLSLNLRVDNRVPGVNQPVTYFLTVTNNGPITATNVVWQNRLPDNLPFVGGSDITFSNNVLSGQIGSLAAGASATFTYQVQPTQPAQYINAAQITASDQTDPDSQPGSGTGDGQDDAAWADFRTDAANRPVYASANPNQVPLPSVQSNQPTPDPTKADLSLVMAVTNRSLKVNEIVTVILQVRNAGGLTATGVASNLVLPTGISFISGDGFTGSGQTLTGYFGSVAAGSTATLTCQVRIDGSGSTVLKAEVTACDQGDTDSQPNSGTTDGQDDTATADLRVSP